MGGGVVEFSDVLARRLGPSVRAEWFTTGQRPGVLGKVFRTMMPFVDAFRLALVLLSQRHDVYHLNPSFVRRALIRDALFILLLRVFGRKKILVFFRGWNQELFDDVALSPVKRRLFLAVYRRAKLTLVLGARFEHELRRIGFPRERIRTITTTFDGELLRQVSRQRTGNEIQILFIARFVATKGIYLLLEAVRRVCNRDPRIVLVMAGDGEERESAQRWVKENGIADKVHFPGYVKETRKAQLLIDSDIFALPSYHGEGCPNALLEAMGAGLAVVVTDVGGIPDIVRNGINGYLIAPRDVDAIESAICRLVDDPGKRAAISANNYSEAWSKYEAAVVVPKLEGHYRSVALTD